MGAHDTYGKQVLRQAAGAAFQDSGPSVKVKYGSRGGATIDGVVANSIAVEIESRAPKQVRGAVLDLICHPYSKKLLVLLPVHMSNPQLCAEQCKSILARFFSSSDYRVVVLNGSGNDPHLETDVKTIRSALANLGHCNVAV